MQKELDSMVAYQDGSKVGCVSGRGSQHRKNSELVYKNPSNGVQN